MCATVRHSHCSIHSVRGPITCRNVADLLPFDSYNKSEVVNESGVNEMHGMNGLNACLHQLERKCETKDGKGPPCYLRDMARGLTNADP